MELFEKSMTILSDLFKRDFRFPLATVKEIESNSNVALFNFFPTHYFTRWELIALLSPLAAYIVWFNRGKGWIAALCAALLIGLPVSKGYNFFYTFSPVSGFGLIAAILLFCILPKNKYQYLRMDSGDGMLNAKVLFQRQGKEPSTIEILFLGVNKINIISTPPNHWYMIFDATLVYKDGLGVS